jgi:predicted RNase H-like HicB family nuclease
MIVTLVIHEEQVDQSTMWWAESEDLPGFYAADATLPGLLARSRSAIEEILEERGEDPSTLELRHSLAPAPLAERPLKVAGKR